MNKINCDVCGTAYPDSASQCPICGCVNSADGNAEQGNRGDSYTYTKGGRFSKSNVRKRNQGMPASFDDIPEDELDFVEEKNDKGLVVAVCILLLAIVAVVIYIITKFFSFGAPVAQNGGMPTLPAFSEPSVSVTTPIETTVATETPTIEETTEATIEDTIAETEPLDQYADYVRPFKLSTEKSKNDVTLHKNSSFELKLKDANGTVVDVEWVATDPSICTIEGNTITGVKIGRTNIQVTIDDVTYSCIVRVVA